MNPTTADDWDQHWDQFGAVAEIGPTPKYRRRLIFKLLSMPADNQSARVLEIGSGTGEFAEEFMRRRPRSNYLGLELSSVGVEISKRRVPGANFLRRDLLQAPDSDAFLGFGATHAICSEVLEHLEKPARLIESASQYMAPGCRLIVTVPGGPMNAFYKHIGHRRHYSPQELRGLLESAGFQVDRTYGAGFPFFNLFRLFITLRGEKFIASVSGPPSAVVRGASAALDGLFHLNLMHWGWQTIAVAKYRGGT